MAYSSLNAMVYGDGAGGKMSTSIETGVMRILYDSGFTWKVATAYSGNGKYGKKIYKIPELLQVEEYDKPNSNPPEANTANWRWQVPQAADKEVVMDKRKIIRAKLEDFDDARLNGSWLGIIDYVINSIGMTILNDLNAYFYARLAKDFDPTNGSMRPEAGKGVVGDPVVMPELTKDGITAEEAKTMIYKLNRIYSKINKLFDKNTMGIPKAELIMILDTMADANIRMAYTNQPNGLAERMIAKDLVGYQLGGEVRYILDKMIGINIKQGQSFNSDYALDTTKFAGFIVHNEAIAMPFNFQKMAWIQDPDDANPRLIVKYQFGWGYLRPHLIVPIYLANVTPKSRKDFR